MVVPGKYTYLDADGTYVTYTDVGYVEPVELQLQPKSLAWIGWFLAILIFPPMLLCWGLWLLVSQASSNSRLPNRTIRRMCR